MRGDAVGLAEAVWVGGEGDCGVVECIGRDL